MKKKDEYLGLTKEQREDLERLEREYETEERVALLLTLCALAFGVGIILAIIHCVEAICSMAV